MFCSTTACVCVCVEVLLAANRGRQIVKVSYDVYVFTAFMQCNLMDKMSEHMMGIQ